MSEISTRSKFFYGFQVTTANRSIDFAEDGGPELQASIAIGAYSASEYMIAVKDALEDVGNFEYDVSLDRTSRKVTIETDDSDLVLLSNSGSRVGTVAWDVLGYDTSTDKTGAMSYEGENGAGSEYRPQATLTQFTAPEDFDLLESAVASESASGVRQVSSYGEGNRVEFNIRLATDKDLRPCNSGDVEYQENGVQNLRDFMKAVTRSERIEFMVDRDNPNTFTKLLILETPDSRNGTGFRLSTSPYAGFYTTGLLLFRVLT